jgi:hypothetical protein
MPPPAYATPTILLIRKDAADRAQAWLKLAQKLRKIWCLDPDGRGLLLNKFGRV